MFILPKDHTDNPLTVATLILDEKGGVNDDYIVDAETGVVIEDKARFTVPHYIVIEMLDEGMIPI